MRMAVLVAALVASVAAAGPQAAASGLQTSPDLGKAEGQCRANEKGPALLVLVSGLKDRKGLLKAEVYPDNDNDFLYDDNLLIMAGKTFRRVEIAVPKNGAVELCIRVPGPGAFALSILHDRDSNRKFGLSSDGLGLASNPDRFCFSKPNASMARVIAGPGLTNVPVRMNYRRGLFCFGALKS